ncbi:MAG: DUF3568 family protein [Alphaproteobacteria bacterium]|nr:DUF3568 family protein [Alphaproteobacteria bacterium]
MTKWGFRRAIRAGSVAAGAIVVLAGVAGCADPVSLTVLGSSSGVAMGTGAEYTLNGIAYKTFTAPIGRVRIAMRDGLNRMGMPVTKDENGENGSVAMVATANDREIEITLEKLTEKATRVRVVADNGFIFKDRATEAAIIEQTADALDRLDSRERLAGKVR